MTYEELLEIEKVQLTFYEEQVPELLPNMLPAVEMLRLEIQAIEKQIPKKPRREIKGVPIARCPNCEMSLGFDFAHFAFCDFCGQALDWSVNESN